MPSTGTPSSSSPRLSAGAPSSYTDAGPPDRISPAGRRPSTSASGASNGTISEYTWHSRTRRAMSWAYCAPKSTTRTGRGSVMGRASVRPHPLLLLERLALGLDGWRHHHLGLLELPDRGVAGGGHGRPERAEQVERSVVLVGRADQDLLERADPARLDPGAP